MPVSTGKMTISKHASGVVGSKNPQSTDDDKQPASNKEGKINVQLLESDLVTIIDEKGRKQLFAPYKPANTSSVVFGEFTSHLKTEEELEIVQTTKKQKTITNTAEELDHLLKSLEEQQRQYRREDAKSTKITDPSTMEQEEAPKTIFNKDPLATVKSGEEVDVAKTLSNMKVSVPEVKFDTELHQKLLTLIPPLSNKEKISRDEIDTLLLCDVSFWFSVISEIAPEIYHSLTLRRSKSGLIILCTKAYRYGVWTFADQPVSFLTQCYDKDTSPYEKTFIRLIVKNLFVWAKHENVKRISERQPVIELDMSRMQFNFTEPSAKIPASSRQNMGVAFGFTEKEVQIIRDHYYPAQLPPPPVDLRDPTGYENVIVANDETADLVRRPTHSDGVIQPMVSDNKVPLCADVNKPEAPSERDVDSFTDGTVNSTRSDFLPIPKPVFNVNTEQNPSMVSNISKSPESSNLPTEYTHGERDSDGESDGEMEAVPDIEGEYSAFLPPFFVYPDLNTSPSTTESYISAVAKHISNSVATNLKPLAIHTVAGMVTIAFVTGLLPYSASTGEVSLRNVIIVIVVSTVVIMSVVIHMAYLRLKRNWYVSNAALKLKQFNSPSYADIHEDCSDQYEYDLRQHFIPGGSRVIRNATKLGIHVDERSANFKNAALSRSDLIVRNITYVDNRYSILPHLPTFGEWLLCGAQRDDFIRAPPQEWQILQDVFYELVNVSTISTEQDINIKISKVRSYALRVQGMNINNRNPEIAKMLEHTALLALMYLEHMRQENYKQQDFVRGPLPGLSSWASRSATPTLIKPNLN